MARPNHQYAKRQRELAKKAKKEEKLRKKREKREGSPDDNPSETESGSDTT